MAFIPDAAIYQSGSISHAAFKLYACYCAHRNRAEGHPDFGTAWPGRTLIQHETGIALTYISKIKIELADAGWIQAFSSRVRLLKGFGKDGADLEKSDYRTKRTDNQTKKSDSQTEKYDEQTISAEQPANTETESTTIRPNSTINTPEKSDDRTPLYEPVKEPVKEPDTHIHTPAREPFESDPDPGFAMEDEPDPNHPVLDIFRKMYGTDCSPLSQERVVREVKNLEIWARVLARTKDNQIPASKVGTIMDIYHDEVKRKPAVKPREATPDATTKNSTPGYKFRPAKRVGSDS